MASQYRERYSFLHFIIFIISILLTYTLSLPLVTIAYADTGELKNLYVLIEPLNPTFNTSSSPNQEEDHDDGVYIMSEVSFLMNLIKWIQKDQRNFSKAIFHIAGLKTSKETSGPPLGNKFTNIYTWKRIKDLNPKVLAKKIYYLGRNIKKYSIAKELAAFSQLVELLQWKGSETLLIVFGDMNYIGRHINSHGAYLNSGWLNNPKSPFRRFYIDEDNLTARQASIVVFTRTQFGITFESKRRAFIYNLFARVDADLKTYYIGPLRNNFLPQKNTDFALRLIQQLQQGRLAPMEALPIADSSLVQIVNSEGSEKNVRSFD